MNPSNAIVGSVVIIVSTTIVRRIREGTWQHHVVETIVFGYLLIVALLVLSVLSPDIAKALAYLGMVGAFVINGPSIFQWLGNFGRGKSAT